MDNELDREYEALVEDYEDALMRLVMYRANRADAERLLKEAEELKNSGFEVPKELDETCRKLIQAGCAPQERNQPPARAGGCENKPSRPLTLRRIGQILAAAILAAVVLFCAAYAANEQFRVNVLNYFLELRENGTWYFFGSGEAQPILPGTSVADGDFPFEFTYIPEGYELFMQDIHDAQANGVRYFETYGYPNHEFKNFSFDIFSISEGLGLLVDTEDAEIKNVKIHGCDGQIIQKIDGLSGEPEIIYVWFDLEEQLGFIFTTMGIFPEESQKIFEGILLNGEHIKIS